MADPLDGSMGRCVLRVGAPMWSLPEWVGRFLPAAGDRSGLGTLAAYATWCNAVEGNTTFYAVPSERTVADWSDQAPTDFRFCFKLPRTITHDRRLRHGAEELDDFLSAIAPLADRCGPVQIQLPPSFGPDDLEALVDFIATVPKIDWSWAVEVRHHQFFPGGGHERALNDVLAGHGVNRVLLDSRPLFAGPCQTPAEIEAFQNKPRVPVRPVATGTQPIVRFIGLTDPEATARHWQQWLLKVAEWLELGLEPFVFVHTPDNIEGLELNRRFHAELRALASADGLAVRPLPEPVEPTRQLDLF